MKKLFPVVFCIFLMLFSVSFISAGTDGGKAVSKDKSPDILSGNKSDTTAPNKKTEKSILKTQKDKISYAVGISMAGTLKQQGADVDHDLVMKGFNDAVKDNKFLLTDEEISTSMSRYYADMRQKHAKIKAIAADKNKKEGGEFLENNKKKEGIITLPSGLQYRIIKTGEGKKPADTDTVECNYSGKLINGTEFDSSYRRGKPAEFKVSGVIPGWQEALKLMPVGSKWQIFVPSELAYGERGAGNTIGPNAALIFDIELLDIK